VKGFCIKWVIVRCKNYICSTNIFCLNKNELMFEKQLFHVKNFLIKMKYRRKACKMFSSISREHLTSFLGQVFFHQVYLQLRSHSKNSDTFWLILGPSSPCVILLHCSVPPLPPPGVVWHSNFFLSKKAQIRVF
jgi:hypothetical protein